MKIEMDIELIGKNDTDTKYYSESYLNNMILMEYNRGLHEGMERVEIRVSDTHASVINFNK